MKKFIWLLLIFFCFLPIFSGCEKNINSVSKNLTSYEINAELNADDNTINATQIVSFVNNTNNKLNNVKFHLYPNAFRENAKANVVSALNKEKCYYNGESYGEIRINFVYIEEQTATYEISGEDENILNVTLKNKLEKKQKTNIQIGFKLQLPQANHRFGVTESTINLGNFYPIICAYENGGFVTDLYTSNGDPFYSDIANYSVNIITPKEYTSAGTGTKTVTQSAVASEHKFKAKAVRDFALVLSPNFKVLTAKIDKTQILYYYLEDDVANESMETIKKALKTFSDLFGSYPYPTYSVVETPFVHGGMEYPTLVYISSLTKNKQDYQQIIIHETAHQWWYGVVGNNQFKEGWLDEALAEYSTALFYKKNPEYNVSYTEIMHNIFNSYLLFENTYIKVLKELDTSIERPLNEFNTEPEYTYLTYVKGNLMFYSLSEVVGEKKLIASLKYYYQQNSFNVANKEKLINAFNKKCYRKLDGIFESWLSGKVVLSKM